MVLTTTVVNNMLNMLEEEDYKMVVSYIQFLVDLREKKRVRKASEVINRIQTIIGDDKGWTTEEEMLEDMARFRKERIGL